MLVPHVRGDMLDSSSIAKRRVDAPKYVAPELSLPARPGRQRLLHRRTGCDGPKLGPRRLRSSRLCLEDQECREPSVRRGLAAGSDRADTWPLRSHRRGAHARARVGRARVRARARAAVSHGTVILSASRSARRRRGVERHVRALPAPPDRPRTPRERAAGGWQRARCVGLALDPDPRSFPGTHLAPARLGPHRRGGRCISRRPSRSRSSPRSRSAPRSTGRRCTSLPIGTRLARR